MGRPFSPQNLPLEGAPFPWGILTPSNTWFPGPTKVLNPKGSSIGAAVFAGLISVTDRSTDHATRSVRIGRIYARSIAMRPKNRAQTSCSPGPILSPSTISFELHAKMAEEIDLEKCNFRNFGSSVTLTLTLDRVEVTLVRICGRGLSSTHTSN